jgi:hypothetical protein
MKQSLPLILAGLLILGTAAVSSQVPDTVRGRTQGTDTLQVLQAQLENKRAERLSMERMIASLNTIDSVYKASFPMWIVLDEDLRERVYESFNSRFSNVQRDTDVIVVGSPDRTHILEISLGGQVMGRRDIAVNLSDSLYSELLSMRYPFREFAPLPPRPKASTQFGIVPRFAAVSASAFAVTMLFANGMGVEVKLGRDEIGYHFWSTGDMRVMAIYKQFRFGFNYQIPSGVGNLGEIVSPIAIRPRKMMGSKGVVMEYEYPLSDASFGAHLSVGENNSMPDNENLFVNAADSNYNYYVHTVLQGWYARTLKFGVDDEHRLVLSGGFGYHQIAAGLNIKNGARIITAAKQDFYSPLVRINYTHEAANSFGVNLQYYGMLIFAHGWLEFIKNFLYLDIKYYSPIIRNPKPWEQPYFFMVSPRIQVIY